MTNRTADHQTYLEEEKSKLNILQAEFATLRGEANMVDHDSKQAYTEAMRDVDQALQRVEARLDQLKVAKGPSFETMRRDYESALNQLTSALRIARTRNAEYTRYN